MANSRRHRRRIRTIATMCTPAGVRDLRHPCRDAVIIKSAQPVVVRFAHNHRLPAITPPALGETGLTRISQTLSSRPQQRGCEKCGLRSATLVASFLTSIVSAITRRWGRADDRVEPDQLETIADVAPAIVWITAADKSCTYVNEQWLRFSGRRREEELGFGWVSAMHPDDVPRCMPIFESAFEARKPVEIEYRQRRHDGVFRWMLSRGVPRFDRDGNFSGYIGVAIDIDDMRAAERDQKRLAAEVAHERERLLGIVSNVPGVVWEAWGQPDESTQRIDFISEHVTRMLGYTVEEWLATPNFWLTIVHPDDREAAAAHAHQHFLAGGPMTNTFRWLTKDGRAIWCEAHSTVIHDEQGAPVGMRGVTLDISARKLAEESLRSVALENEQLYRAAMEASAAKDEFLATVSHELRTPMTATLGWVRLMMLGQVDAETSSSALNAIESATRAQSKLIDDILDVSSIVLGKFRLETAAVDLHNVVDVAAEALRPTLDAKSIAIDVEASGWSGTVQGDANRLQQVVWNLLANAAKFGHRGGRIEVIVEREGAVGRVIVRDDGEGIEPEFLPHVFDRFRQGDSGLTRTHGGLGLGLAIVQHLVELHGGSVSASSEGRGKGSTFIVELPASDDIAETAMVERSAAPDLRRKQILVVDNDVESLESLAVVLREYGARVTTVRSAAEAILALCSHHDLVVTDAGVVVTEGVTLAQQLRHGNGGVPAIVLRKPVDPLELAAEISRLLTRPGGA